MDDESGRGESVSPLVGGPKTHRSSVRPPVRPSSMHQAAVARAQPTCAAHLPCTRRRRHRAADRPTDRPTNGRGRLAAAQKPAAQAAATAAATKWGAIPSPLSQPASLAAGEGEKGEGPKAPSPCRWPTKRARSELRPTPLAGWREGGRAAHRRRVLWARSLVRFPARSLIRS